jgi:hypothetical protein
MLKVDVAKIDEINMAKSPARKTNYKQGDSQRMLGEFYY